MGTPHDLLMETAVVLLAFVGVLLAAAFAVLAGTLSARIFLDATKHRDG